MTLLRDSDSKVRATIAAREDLPEHLYEILAEDEDERVRVAIINNSNTPDAILDDARQDMSLGIQLALQEKRKSKRYY